MTISFVTTGACEIDKHLDGAGAFDVPAPISPFRSRYKRCQAAADAYVHPPSTTSPVCPLYDRALVHVNICVYIYIYIY